MTRKFFGTDGVRGPYGGPLVNEAFAARLGRAAARWWTGARGPATGGRGGVTGSGDAAGALALIGWDTRASGESLARAVARGLRAGGAEPALLGVVPTPAVARAVRERRAGLGVVITASHNPAADNGIKFFGPGGVKLTDEEEAAIEQLIADEPVAEGGAAGPALDGAASEYVKACTALLPANALSGWSIVLDTAHGATCATTPAVLRACGADVAGIGDAPDGTNINAGVGSEHPERLVERVRATGARLGIAHDGDGDRCVLCDERGELLDGDEILAVLATHALARGALPGRTLVVTVQSNLGLDAAVKDAGGAVERTAVGDRYVVERMRAVGAALGGESSGHIVCADVSPTGDGLVAALKVIEVMRATGRPLSELRKVMRKFPQRTAAVMVKDKQPLEKLPALQAAIRGVEAEFGERGRVLVRYSGTEPKLRLLVEGPTVEGVTAALARIEVAARSELGG
ncbi:MAG TPA: phosphoglucosamine mutase [Opitutus sp.]|nr:phosphoglucosamine mutase [Opitutus sp.]